MKFFVAFFFGLFGFVFLSNVANAQIPMNMSPGAIMQHQMNTRFMQQRTPWVTRPVTQKELEPPKTEVLVHEDFLDGGSSSSTTGGILTTPDGDAYIFGE